MFALLTGDEGVRITEDTADEGGVQLKPGVLETGVIMNAPSVCGAAASLLSV